VIDNPIYHGGSRQAKPLFDEHRQDLPGKEFGQTRIIDPGNLREDSRFVQAAVCRREMNKEEPLDGRIKAVLTPLAVLLGMALAVFTAAVLSFNRIGVR